MARKRVTQIAGRFNAEERKSIMEVARWLNRAAPKLSDAIRYLALTLGLPQWLKERSK